MRLNKFNRKKTKAAISLILALVLIVSTVAAGGVTNAKAATTITSMAYYSAGDGPVISHSGVENASYGFVMPIFNGGAATWNDVADDLHVNVKVDGTWTDIDSVPYFVYNSTWGHWNDGGFTGYWFQVTETTELQLQSIANPDVTLNYTLQFTKLDTTNITSMAYYSGNDGPVINASVTGGAGFCYPIFNGNNAITYEQVADDLKAYVKTANDADWVDLDNNAASGWIYDSNFGQFWDGPGGYWFTVDETIQVRLQSKSDPSVYLDYTINYAEPVRNSYVLTPDGSTTLTAGTTGSIGLILPYIDGGRPVKSELDNFVYELKVDGQWVAMNDFTVTGFTYQANGYKKNSASNQWGYWADGIYGLWFQPIQENMSFRVGYPLDGEKGGNIGNNYVEYTFVGNPDAPRPDPANYADITVGTIDDYELDGWNLIWNDEFDGNALDMSKWSHQTGYYLNEDPGTWGWGNNELEYYTDSTKNTFVSDGKLTLRMLNEPTTFDIDPSRVAPYSSGKVVSQNKFSFKYGRIDYCAKLPTGTGIWPALWMMPNDEVYGTWAASGEIDVMEARGRLPGTVCGTIHYGGTWPANDHAGEDYYFPEGSTFDDGFHVYSCVWEEDAIKWYVDGDCYSVITYEEWYTNAAIDSPYAPFDQEFYVIMNLAAGGWFDGGAEPNAASIPCEMQVEYVRVYQPVGDTSGSYTNNGGGTIVTPDPTEASSEESSQAESSSEESSQAESSSEESSQAESSSEESSQAESSSEESSQAEESSSEESSQAGENPAVAGDDYVYDPDAGTVTITYRDSATSGAIVYAALYDNEEEARAAYQIAVDALPGINLPGHGGYFMNSADGVHTHVMNNVREGQWFVYGINALDNGGFKQEWKIGAAVTPQEESSESSEEETDPRVEPSQVTGGMAVYSNGAVNLTWEDNGAEMYKVARSDGRSGYINLTYKASAAGYTDTKDLIEGQLYYYRVIGYFRDAEGNLVMGEMSAQIPVVVLNGTPTKVENVVPTIEGKTVTLNWDAASNVRYYKVSRASGADGKYYTMKYNIVDTTYTETLSAAGLYRYKVVGYYKDVDGGWVYGDLCDTLYVRVK